MRRGVRGTSSWEKVIREAGPLGGQREYNQKVQVAWVAKKGKRREKGG